MRVRIYLQKFSQFLLLTFLFPCIASAATDEKVSFSGCAPSTASTDLDIGNVRARILVDGEMWWEHTDVAMYFVPKASGLSPLFATGLWFGGKDSNGQLKLAAQTYRQSGTDFWPGPIDTVTGDVDPATCAAYDRVWKITRLEVAYFLSGIAPTQTIIDWPGNGSGNYPHYLAPYVDINGDGEYHSSDGDYPAYDFGQLGSVSTFNKLSGDQTVFWVFNDCGNTHGSTYNSNKIGLEIQAQAYVFCTADSDLMNTTFYNYKVINRSASTLYDTYAGVFTESDLGNYLDDLVGCDVERDMGYSYNGDDDDDGPLGYGTRLAAVGIDILSGFASDPGDGIDNNRNFVIDEPGEEIRMSTFRCYYGGGANYGHPIHDIQYYYYLSERWLDGRHITYGGIGYNLSGDSANFMFPGDSDPNNFGTFFHPQSFLWTEEEPWGPGSLPYDPSDRKFLMTSGKFTMQPGAVQTFSTAAVFARVSGGIAASVSALKSTDDRIQSFFDSHFTNIPTCAVHIGIDEVNSNFQLLIYPSPSSSQLSMQIPDGEKIDCTIRIFDALGKEIKSLETKNRTEISLSVADWVPGIYYYSIKSHKGQMIGGKFLVIH